MAVCPCHIPEISDGSRKMHPSSPRRCYLRQSGMGVSAWLLGAFDVLRKSGRGPCVELDFLQQELQARTRLLHPDKSSSRLSLAFLHSVSTAVVFTAAVRPLWCRALNDHECRSRPVSRRTARSGGTSRRATGVSGSTGSIPVGAVTPVGSTTTASCLTSSTLGTSERCVPCVHLSSFVPLCLAKVLLLSPPLDWAEGKEWGAGCTSVR